MVLGDDIEGRFNVSDQNVAVLHLDSELFLKGLVHMDGCLDIGKSSLVPPVSVEGNGNSLYLKPTYVPAIGVDLVESFMHAFDDSLGSEAGLGGTSVT
jgi:hypothetical protein